MNLLPIICGALSGVILAQVPAIDSKTNIPLGAAVGSAVTIFLTGMWVSRKVTRFEEQQVRNMERLDSLEDRVFNIEHRL